MSSFRLNNKLLLNQVMLLTFVAAFLTMQWTTTHVHLGEGHDHDGGHHQHNVEVHAHYSIDSNVSAEIDVNNSTDFDLSHQSNKLNVIEFNSEFSTQQFGNFNDPEQPSVSVITSSYPQTLHLLIAVTIFQLILTRHLVFCIVRHPDLARLLFTRSHSFY